MSTRERRTSDTRMPDPNFVHPEIIAPETRAGAAFRYVSAALRLSLGWVFLWAFLDKAFGLGYATPGDRAWVNGGSPTRGYLENATTGPFADTFQSFAGAAWADWLFMVGLLGIGVALIAGIGMRVAAGAGALLMALMWLSVLPKENNWFLDDHIVYGLALVGLALVGAGHTLGLGAAWERLALVQRYRWLA